MTVIGRGGREASPARGSTGIKEKPAKNRASHTQILGDCMNSMTSTSRIVAAVLCTVALTACDSIESVSEQPTFAIPPEKVVINGSITGLSATRPVELELELTNNGLNDGTTTQSVRGTEVLRFGAVNVGANYNITVSRNPQGRICEVQNGSGTAMAEVNNVSVSCVRDGTPLYTLTANIAPALASAPPEGFALTLTTEEGVETIHPGVGETSVTFDLPVFYPGANPPTFNYQVRATNTLGGTTNNCAVTNGSGSLGFPADPAPPSLDITDVTVTGCVLSISAVANYDAPLGGAPQPMGAGGLQLGVLNSSGDVVAEAPLINAYGTTPVAIPGTWVSNSSALYEVSVLNHPDGQFCVVRNGGLASLVNPVSFTAQVRCRNIPAEARRLTGSYQLRPPAINNTTGEPNPDTQAELRNFLTFFANGSFIYGTHHSSSVLGVEHGFYNYDPALNTLTFTVWTDTNGGTSPASFSGDFLTGFGSISFTTGLSGRAGYSYPLSFSNFQYEPGTVTATNVVKTQGSDGVPGTLSLTFGSFAPLPTPPATTPAANLNPTWHLVEPLNTQGQMQGTWVTPDSKRVWIYNKDTTYGFHAGLNGAPNLQDACFTIENPVVSDGYYTRRGGDTGCMSAVSDTDPRLVSVGTVDVPNANSNPPLVPGFVGRMPGSQSNAVATPSPVYFTIESGLGGGAETLTLQNTLNDVPLGKPLVFQRAVTN